MRTILALAVKDLKLLMRDRVGFFFVFFFPLVYATFFGVIFSGAGGGMSPISIVVVDEDDSEGSRAFITKLEGADELKVYRANREEAASLVRRGKRVAYLILPDGFGEARDRIFGGDAIRMEVGLDPSRKAESGLIQGVLTQHAFEILQGMFSDRQAMREQAQRGIASIEESGDLDPISTAVLKRFLLEVDKYFDQMPGAEEGEEGAGPGFGKWEPIQIDFSEVGVKREGPKTSFDITFPQSIVWVLIGCAAAFGISIVVERTGGTLMRLRSAPISLAQILSGKALACFLTTLAGSTALFLFFALVFGLRANSYPLLVLGIVSGALAFVGIMMLASVMGKTEASAGGIVWALLLIFAMLGGGMIPLMMMPSWMQTFSNISFVKWIVLALEGAIWRDFSFMEMMLPCGILLAIGVITFSLGVRLFRYTTD